AFKFLVDRAVPICTHAFLARLDREGRLLRCYTQNIDGLEERVGLRRSPTASPWCTGDENVCLDARIGGDGSCRASLVTWHGGLDRLSCTLCSAVVPWTATIHESARQGIPSACPQCQGQADLRAALGKRRRAVGVLRPAIVLYNEPHPNAQAIGQCQT